MDIGRRLRSVFSLAQLAPFLANLFSSFLLLLLAASAVLGQSLPFPSTGRKEAIGNREQRTRWERWFLRGRTIPGQSAGALPYRAYQQKMQMRAARLAQTQKPGSPALPQLSRSGWSSLGPAPLASDASGDGQQDYGWVSGRATAIAVDPADSSASTVYLGGAYGGVWKSANARSPDPGSVIWSPRIDDEATLAVGAIAIQPQPTNPDPTRSVILVGTGESNSSDDSYYGLGILRSPDAGTTWNLISSDTTGTHPFAGLAFSKIAFSTNNPNLAAAATASATQGILEARANSATANLGLYYSTDGGNTWTYSNVKDGNAPTDAASATTVVYNVVAGQFFAALRYHGFYSSSDGINWTRLANQPGAGLTTSACPAQSSTAACPIYRGELAVVPGRNEMYAWYVDVNDNDQGIWETINGGATWTPINDSGITNCGDDLGCGTDQGTYNLELAAVPNGGATDLYAGATNIYKCQITSASPNCSGGAPNTFLNLTHAYGCSSIARVHPAQHALSFLLVNNNQQDVMYFANDGGIYRALDGYTGLTTGDCGGSNQFDSLNQTLGSMTQFVSFSQPAGDANTILGGSQGNGSPATQSALAGSPWLNVDAGDGGYNQINPDNPAEWYVSNPPNSVSGVNVFRCTSGINCHTQDFQNDQVVSSATVGGDTGAYYPPYLLDPQNSSELIIGTCRVWRGSSTGANFTLLSNNFETVGSGICTGNETNLVRSLAVGGPPDSNGSSNVIYAGTDGLGPLIPAIPPGGHLWASTNVAGGSATWSDQTGAINPHAFPISGIAIDSSDPTGLTAYVTIMGFSTVQFPTSHVWKTTDGGEIWTDFTGSAPDNLPDAPANAVFVDPGLNPLTGTVYVATDVGVFSTLTASPNWTEVGPAPGKDQTGYLPNVAVTALRMFNDGVDKWLRASTYGRGVWQFPLITTPDFLISIVDTPLTVFADSLPAIFHGSLYALDGYNNTVNLSCSGPQQTTCSVAPSQLVPTPSGAPFTVTATSPDGTYTFDLQGVGTDSGKLTHHSPFTLNVVDFNLTALSPGSLTVAPGNISAPAAFQVTAAGPFSQAVNLSCTGLPSGATCNFQPSSSVNPTSNAPVSVTLTISTNTHTTAGTFPVTISGSTANGPTRTQNLSLTVTQDYFLAISNPSLTAYEDATTIYDGTLISLNGYSSPVNLSCGNGAPPTCTAAPATVTPTAQGAPFTVTVSSNQCGQYNFNIVAQGTDSLHTSHSSPVTFYSKSPTPPDYALEIFDLSLAASVNSPAIFNGTLIATACYSSPVNLNCGSGAPPSCTASPTSLVPTAAGAPFTVTVSSDRVQTYNFSIAGQGTDPAAIQHSAVVSFSSTPASSFTFSLTNTSGPQSVKAGQTATFQLQVAPGSGTFPDPVTLALLQASDCPPLALCSFSPSQVATGQPATSVSLTIQTSAPVIADVHCSHTSLLYAFTTLFLGLVGVAFGIGKHRRRKQLALLLTMALIATLFLMACGGGLQGGSTAAAQPGTPLGTYNLTVTATMSAAPGSPQKSTSVTLTIN